MLFQMDDKLGVKKYPVIYIDFKYVNFTPNPA
jgi:hypothetical protein